MLTGFYDRARWQLTFAWLPHRCEITKRYIWLKLAYRGAAMWTGPGDPVYEYRWHDRLEHLIWKIKGN